MRIDLIREVRRILTTKRELVSMCAFGVVGVFLIGGGRAVVPLRLSVNPGYSAGTIAMGITNVSQHDVACAPHLTRYVKRVNGWEVVFASDCLSGEVEPILGPGEGCEVYYWVVGDTPNIFVADYAERSLAGRMRSRAPQWLQAVLPPERIEVKHAATRPIRHDGSRGQ